MAMPFTTSLRFGEMGESDIAKWLRKKGHSVLPAYEKEIDTGKGPRLFTPDETLVTPDFLIFPDIKFIEAKHKSVFTWHHRTTQWTTGIDLHHYSDYQKVQSVTGRKVWLLFLHRLSQPHIIDTRGRADCRHCQKSVSRSCCPQECPTGLFGASLNHLKEHEHHKHQNQGKHGMVYWWHGDLKCLARIDEL
jgi:hypothetical protein